MNTRKLIKFYSLSVRSSSLLNNTILNGPPMQLVNRGFHHSQLMKEEMKKYLAKKKSTVESLIANNNITGALKLFYEEPKARNAESLILSEYLSVDESLAVYNSVKDKGYLNEKVIVAILCVCKDKKIGERDKILNDAYECLMSLKVGEKNSMNAFKWNTILANFISESSLQNINRALEILNHSEEFGYVPSKFVIGNLLSACVNVELYKAAVEIFCKLDKYHIKPDILHFNFYIKALTKLKFTNIALETLRKMEALNLKPDSYIYSTLISACGETKYIEQGKQLHKIVLEKGLSNIY